MSYTGMIINIVDAEGNIVCRNAHHKVYNECSRADELAKNLSGQGWNIAYDFLPYIDSAPKLIPENERHLLVETLHYYDFRCINIKDYFDWFRKYCPCTDAGWVTTYEKWLYDTKNIVPEVSHYLDKDAVKEDTHFIEVMDDEEPGYWLYTHLGEFNTKNPIAEYYMYIYFYNN